MRLKRALSIMLSTAVLLSGIPACADQGEIGEVEVQDGISELPGDNQEFIESVFEDMPYEDVSYEEDSFFDADELFDYDEDVEEYDGDVSTADSVPAIGDDSAPEEMIITLDADNADLNPIKKYREEEAPAAESQVEENASETAMVGGPIVEEENASAEIALASEIQASKVLTQCTVYNGSNVEKQNYETYGSTVKSYLTTSPDGGLMRVQYGIQDNKNNTKNEIIIEYYDTGYNIQKTITLTPELPIFGGFYESDNAYFVLTGQENKNENNKRTVFRVSKYTKSWKHIASIDVKGANTIGPFDAGSARFAMSGIYLVIRTCHTMYKSDDGLNHQANVTIVLDASSMNLINVCAEVEYYMCDYVSHSFNQFIIEDGNQMVSIDHGDAYPRSIVMNIFPKPGDGVDYTEWAGDDTKTIDVIQFEGATGDNYTGASVGALEASDGYYLVVGNQDDVFRYPTCRNVFVAAVPKTGGKPTVRFFTSYNGTDDSATTPHLVKLNSNRFLLMWSSRAFVYYQPLDGAGKSAGKIRKFKGNLSDCVPKVIGDKVIWYTWNNGMIVFYEISASDLSQHNAVIVNNGHELIFENKPVKGVLTGVCQACGKTLKYSVPTGMSLWWRNQDQIDSNDYFWSATRSDVRLGDKVQYWAQLKYTSDLEEKLDDFEVITSNKKIMFPTDRTSAGSFLETGGEKGYVWITLRSRYNKAVSVKRKFNVGMLHDDTVSLKKYRYPYTGKQIKPKVTVRFADKVLKEGKDYKVIYSNNVKIGKGVVKVKGIGKYAGSGKKTFEIYKA